jgi:hypothetical protein
MSDDNEVSQAEPTPEAPTVAERAEAMHDVAEAVMPTVQAAVAVTAAVEMPNPVTIAAAVEMTAQAAPKVVEALDEVIQLTRRDYERLLHLWHFAVTGGSRPDHLS